MLFTHIVGNLFSCSLTSILIAASSATDIVNCATRAVPADERFNTFMK